MINTRTKRWGRGRGEEDGGTEMENGRRQALVAGVLAQRLPAAGLG